MKMKKFINAPETITDEELTGLGLAYPRSISSSSSVCRTISPSFTFSTP